MIVEYEHIPQGINPKHLLWALMHIQVYATEPVLAGIAKTDEKTYRKWSYAIRYVMSELTEKIVSVFLFQNVSFY